jgi:hypothetical protein
MSVHEQARVISLKDTVTRSTRSPYDATLTQSGVARPRIGVTTLKTNYLLGVLGSSF